MQRNQDGHLPMGRFQVILSETERSRCSVLFCIAALHAKTIHEHTLSSLFVWFRVNSRIVIVRARKKHEFKLEH